MLTVLVGREMYGLEILEQLNLERPVDELKFGSLYPALNRLEAKDLVVWRWGDEGAESGGARRKYYQVIELGARSLYVVQAYRLALAERPTHKTRKCAK